MPELILGQSPELRVLVTPICQLRCIFCHNEGQPGEQNTWKSNTLLTLRGATYFQEQTIERVLLPLREALGITTVHLTGGEPTLHPNIVELAAQCRKQFPLVKMTTNGVFAPALLKEIKGILTEVIFSVHATSWEKFQLIQGNHLPQTRAQEYFLQQMDNIRHAKELGFSAKINSVVLHKETTIENIRFANSLGLEIRLLRDLENPHQSEQIIQEIISQEEVKLENVQMGTADSSAYREVYANDGMRFTLKRIQEVYLKGMCDNCPIIDRCREYFYGLRIEPDGRIRLCIHRDDSGVLMTLDEFLGSSLLRSVRAAYYPKGESIR